MPDASPVGYALIASIAPSERLRRELDEIVTEAGGEGDATAFTAVAVRLAAA